MKNIPEFSVSEITSLTKNILEENFERVRIRGEVSKIKENKGHLYFSLKDENFILMLYAGQALCHFCKFFRKKVWRLLLKERSQHMQKVVFQVIRSK